MKITTIITFLLGLNFQALSQSLSVEKALELALQNNLGFAASKEKVAFQEAMVRTTKEIPKTNFELQYGNIQTPNVGDYTFTVGQNFFHPKVNTSKKALYESFVEKSRTQNEIEKIRLIRDVRQSFYALAKTQETISLIQKQIPNYQSALQKANLRLEQGETSILEKLSFENKLQGLLQELQVIESLEKSQRKQLGQLLKQELDGNVLTNSFFETAKIDIGQSDSPFITSLENDREILTKEQEVIKAELSPSFLGGLTNQSMGGSLSQFFVTGGINIPIYRKSTNAKVQALGIQKNVIELEKDNLQNQLDTEIETLRIQLVSSNKSLEYFKFQAIPTAELIIETVKQQYYAGEIGYLEFQQNFDQAYHLQEQNLTVLLNHKILESNILYLLGK